MRVAVREQDVTNLSTELDQLQFSCRNCGERYAFDRYGMLRAALDARGEPYYRTRGGAGDALDVVVQALAEDLPNYADELTLERLSTLYKLQLSTDGFGDVIASAR